SSRIFRVDTYSCGGVLLRAQIEFFRFRPKADTARTEIPQCSSLLSADRRRNRVSVWISPSRRPAGARGKPSPCLARALRSRRRLAPATGDSVLGLDLDWPARVAEVAPHFVAHSSTNFVRQGCQCLAGGSAAAFKWAVIRVE